MKLKELSEEVERLKKELSESNEWYYRNEKKNSVDDTLTGIGIVADITKYKNNLKGIKQAVEAFIGYYGVEKEEVDLHKLKKLLDIK